MFTQISLSGTLTQDLELKTSSNGKSFLVGSIAVNGARDSQSQTYDYNVDPEYYSVIIFLQNVVEKAQFFTKGLFVTLTGKMERQSYTANDGSLKFRNKITVDDINPYIQGAELAKIVVQAINSFKEQKRSQSGNLNGGFNNWSPQDNNFVQYNQTPNSFNQTQTNSFQTQAQNSFSANNNDPRNFGSVQKMFGMAENQGNLNNSFKTPTKQNGNNQSGFESKVNKPQNPDDIPF